MRAESKKSKKGCVSEFRHEKLIVVVSDGDGVCVETSAWSSPCGDGKTVVFFPCGCRALELIEEGADRVGLNWMDGSADFTKIEKNSLLIEGAVSKGVYSPEFSFQPTSGYTHCFVTFGLLQEV